MKTSAYRFKISEILESRYYFECPVIWNCSRKYAIIQLSFIDGFLTAQSICHELVDSRFPDTSLLYCILPIFSLPVQGKLDVKSEIVEASEYSHKNACDRWYFPKMALLRDFMPRVLPLMRF